MHEYDFFISYKWKKYKAEAEQMLRLARRFGYSAWIDHEHPFEVESDASQEEADRQLAEHLRRGMESCAYVIFFETYTELAATVNGPGQRVIGWQERELDMAEAKRLIALYHSAEPPFLTFGHNKDAFDYGSLEEAFGLIVKGIRNPDDYFTDGGGGGGAEKEIIEPDEGFTAIRTMEAG